VFYVTHVGVFRLTARGMTLVAAMPGIDVQRDIVRATPMRVVIPRGRRVPRVPTAIVTGAGLSLDTCRRIFRSRSAR
jgi:acyl CoA:acetate/3-ketoacid CoA transferase